MAVTFVAIARVPAAGVECFARYEDAVLPLVADHGGRLERRLRSADGRAEVHVLTFASHAAFDGYRTDPRRAEQARLLAASGAELEVLELEDV